MTRINRVSVLIEDDIARISLYKTNTKIAELYNSDIGVADFSVCGVENKNTYQQYCRDLVTNLLQNGGIEGLYYEEKQVSDTDTPKKFGTSSFVSDTLQRAQEAIRAAMSETMELNIPVSNVDKLEISERYKDGNIKFASVLHDMIITNTTNGKKIAIEVIAEIKSGQMCKIKHFKYYNAATEPCMYTINSRNISGLLR